MYNYYPTNQQSTYRPQQQLAIGLKGRPVASIDEARAATIDFDGSIFFFPDLANKRIYTKHINIDGTMSLNMYELRPIEDNTTVLKENYVTREEFEQAIAQLKSAAAVQPITQTGAGTQFECKF